MFVVLCVVPFLLLVQRGPRGKPRLTAFIATVFAIALLLYSLAVLNIFPALQFMLEPVIAFTGKDATFSGRTAIWEVIRDHISQRPLLGTGYGAYWIGPVPTSPSYVFLKHSNFYPTEAHNGYLDVINDLGYVGLACLIGYLFLLMRQCLALRRIDFVQATLYIGLIFEQFINNMTESNWFSAQSFVFVIVTLLTFALARANVEMRLRSAVEASMHPPAEAVSPAARPLKGLNDLRSL
jgi:exopolysaccharide production protein ExoQ